MTIWSSPVEAVLLQVERAVLDMRQHMPREQVGFGRVRIARQDEGLDPLGLIGAQLGEHLIGRADDRRPAARARPADAGAQVLFHEAVTIGRAALTLSLIPRLARGGEIVLCGFYTQALSFAFPPAFMKEMRLRIAAEWQPADLVATRALIESGALSLDGLITHRHPGADAPAAYRTAFEDATCLKMILDWKDAA